MGRVQKAQVRHRRKSSLIRQRGFISFNAGAFLLWLIVYGWLGRHIGARFEHPAIGMILGLVVGFYPASQLGVSGHYSFGLAYLPLPAVVLLYFFPDQYRLWLAAAVCSAPAILIPILLFKSKSNYPLHDAATDGRTKRVKRLLAKGAAVNRIDQEGRTPLHKAALGGYPDIVLLLLENGADPKARDKEDRTPLKLAQETADYWNPGPNKEEAIRIMQDWVVGEH